MPFPCKKWIIILEKCSNFLCKISMIYCIKCKHVLRELDKKTGWKPFPFCILLQDQIPTKRVGTKPVIARVILIILHFFSFSLLCILCKHGNPMSKIQLEAWNCLLDSMDLQSNLLEFEGKQKLHSDWFHIPINSMGLFSISKKYLKLWRNVSAQDTGQFSMYSMQ